MITSKIRQDIMKFYGITDYENYDIVKVEPDNMKIYNKKTGKIINLRY